MTDLEWTDEPPEEEGSFWFNPPYEDPQIIYAYRSDNGENLYLTGLNIARYHIDDAMEYPYFGDAKWAGPIPRPSDPNQDS
jgi:hypothetical protein